MNAKTTNLKPKITMVISLSILLSFVYFVLKDSLITAGPTLITFALIAITMEAAERVLLENKLPWMAWIRSADFRASMVKFALLGAASCGAWDIALSTSTTLWYCIVGVTVAGALFNLVAAFKAS